MKVMTKPLRRDNHYLPCMYLKQWAQDDGRVWIYRTLVSHNAVPPWKRVSPRGAAFHRHLYVRIVAGVETDEFEQWLDQEFESPAAAPLQTATSGARMTRSDWRHLIRFAAAQDVRTPARFEAGLARWEQDFSEGMETSLQETMRAIEKAVEGGKPLPEVATEESDGFPLRVMLEPGEDGETGRLGVEITIGRGLWLWGMRRLLTSTLSILQQHKWTVLRPPEGSRWFTTDNPVVRLNNAKGGSYDFGGGWNRPGSEILLPLGPQHLLYTQVGKRPPQRDSRVSAEHAGLFRRIIAEHAHRMIICAERDDDVPALRPRVEDDDLYRRDKERWSTWHEHQSAAEHDALDTGGASP